MIAVGAVTAALALVGGAVWARRPADVPSGGALAVAPPAEIDHRSGDSIQPIPRAPLGDPRKVALGRRLFNDARISGDGSVSCASCHSLEHGGADGKRVAIGVGGAAGPRNTPTVYNADLNLKQFWDGRVDTLEAQVSEPLESALEMSSSWPRALSALGADDEYVRAFAAIYPHGLTIESAKDAIATFERSLVTSGSPFDRYLAGDGQSLSPTEIVGYGLFKSYGCISCHQGRNVGGNLFEKMGIMGDYFAERGGPVLPSDLGRFNVTHHEEDRFTFRVPPLRLVAQTAPYFHDGRAETLEQAIRLMGKYQLGEDIPPHDVAAIAAFLGSLGTKIDGEAHAPR